MLLIFSFNSLQQKLNGMEFYGLKWKSKTIEDQLGVEGKLSGITYNFFILYKKRGILRERERERGVSIC